MGPIASLTVIVGNVGVILGLLPSHVVWTIYTLIKLNRFDTPLKVAILLALPALFCIWLGLSVAGSVLVGAGYGFFSPYLASFEAFRHENESKRFFHCIVDGTWGTIKDSCTMVQDFVDMCYHTYPLFLKELCDTPCSNEIQPLRFLHVPSCVIVGIMGLIVEIPLYTVIAVVKSPYMLFKGWQQLIHDVISREGPFLETACIPIAGLAILLWPLIVLACVVISVFISILVALYGPVVVYQERSFRRGVAYVIAMVAEFDEYTNDYLYLREGSIFPKPRYRKEKISHLPEFAGMKTPVEEKIITCATEPPAMLIPTMSSAKSVKDAIQEVKMVQVWGNIMKSCEVKGQELLDMNIIKPNDLYEWLKAKQTNEASIVGVGLPCYSFLQMIFHSVKSGVDGLIMIDGYEINNLNRPQDRLLDWFFQPVMLLKEQIKVLGLDEIEMKFLQKVLLFGNDIRMMKGWENEGLVPQDSLRAAQIQGISRRMIGMTRSISKIPTYRRKFRNVVKALIIYSLDRDEGLPTRSMSSRSVASV